MQPQNGNNRKSTITPHISTIILLLISTDWMTGNCDSPAVAPIASTSTQGRVPCLVGMCTNRHVRLVEEYGTRPTPSAEYCLLLKDYLRCLNDSFHTCLAQLDFHSATTSAQKRWRTYGCEKFDRQSREQQLGEQCQFWEHDEDEDMEEEYDKYGEEGVPDEENEQGEEKQGHSSFKQCSIFGQLHLLSSFRAPFLEKCAFSGARPLFENRFFLIQITTVDLKSKLKSSSQSDNLEQIFAVSKIAVIVRPYKGCVLTQKLYLADANDEGLLPGAFEDGTIKVGGEENSKRAALEIVRLTKGSGVEILIRYLKTTIRVRKFGNQFLNIFIHTSTHLPRLDYETKQLCMDACWEGQQSASTRCAIPYTGQREKEQIEVQGHCAKYFGEKMYNGSKIWFRACKQDLASSAKEMVALWTESIQSAAQDKLVFDRSFIDKNATEQSNGVNRSVTDKDAGTKERCLPLDDSTSGKTDKSPMQFILATSYIIIFLVISNLNHDAFLIM